MADTTVSVQALINNSISRGKDPDKTQWEDSQLLNFVNRAVDYIHKLLIKVQSEIGIEEATVTMVASTQEYSLADNMPDFWSIAVNGVYFSSVEKPLLPVSYEDKIREGSDTTSTDPKSFYITSTNIGVVNIPNATSVAAYPTLSCRYFKKNTTLVLTDSMPYKNVFNEPISLFMDSLAQMKAKVPTEEFISLFNALEESALIIINSRVPL
jgi:hypothetical protein